MNFPAHAPTLAVGVGAYHIQDIARPKRPSDTNQLAKVVVDIATLLKHLVRRIRRHWPRTRLTFRGDSHYGRTEAMAWCEDNGVDYIFGLAGNPVLHRFAYGVADDLTFALRGLRSASFRPRLLGVRP